MKTLVAVAQMTSTDNKAKNLSICEDLIRKAAQKGAQFLSLPENFAYFGSGYKEIKAYAEELKGPTISHLARLAQENNIWLSLGGFQELILNIQKIHNTHIIINNQGEIISKYRKIYLFSAILPDGSSYDENKWVVAGNEIVIAQTPFFKAGLSICYDLRFSNLYWALRLAGAQVILVPAAFTQVTGEAHWEVLLRARAIETQSYVLASAQVGEHNRLRKTYGHAMIVDPWGRIIAQCSDNEDLALGLIDLDYLYKLRENMPIDQHWKAL